MGEINRGIPSEAAIVVVAKAPQVGKVKTRLCPPLSYEQAAALYGGFLLDTVEIALSVSGCAVKVVCPTEGDALILKKLLPAAVGYIVQTGTGLSSALSESFEKCLEWGYRKIFCISSDNPTLPPAYLELALEALESSRLVLGPSEDGGYYLIGAKEHYSYLFENMSWSNSSVLSETLNRAVIHRASFQLLPEWYDLDTAQDLTRFIGELSENQAQARYTRQVLVSLDVKEFVDAAN